MTSHSSSSATPENLESQYQIQTSVNSKIFIYFILVHVQCIFYCYLCIYLHSCQSKIVGKRTGYRTSLNELNVHTK
jgi:hypothetical protein